RLRPCPGRRRCPGGRGGHLRPDRPWRRGLWQKPGWRRSIDRSFAESRAAQGGVQVRIEIRGRNAAVTESLRKHVDERFRKIAKQVSELATLELELRSERNPAIADGKLVDA